MPKLPDLDWRIKAYNELVNIGFKVELDDRIHGMPTRSSGDFRYKS